MTTRQMKAAIHEYQRLRTLVPLGTLRTKKDYVRAVALPPAFRAWRLLELCYTWQ